MKIPLIHSDHIPQDQSVKGWGFYFFLFCAAAFLFRFWTLTTLPELAQADFDEGGVGMQARHILMGELQTFWWGHPYLGASGFYWAAAGFKLLGSSTFVLRLVSLIISMLAVIFSGLLAKELFGKKWSLFTLLWWIIPAAYLTRLSLTPYCYINCVAYGNITLYLACITLYKKPESKPLWFFLGLFMGLLLWEHLVNVCYLAAIGLFILKYLYQNPGKRKAPILLLLTGFLIGNFPFWFWNIRHNFETITAMLIGKNASSNELLPRVDYVFFKLLPELLGNGNLTFAFWNDPDIKHRLMYFIAFLYIPVLLYGLYLLKNTLLRFFKNTKTATSEALMDPVILLFFFACGQVIVSHYWKGLYLMPSYSAIPILFTAFAKTLSRRYKSIPVLMLLLLLFITSVDNYKMHENGIPLRHNPRPVDQVISFLKQNNITHAYAHYNIAWYLMFESKEQIVTSDYNGFLDHLFYQNENTGIDMKPFFSMMHKVDLSDNIACISHDVLNPISGALEDYFAILGADYKKRRIGQYTVYYQFVNPVRTLKEILPETYSLSSNTDSADLENICDKNISTLWTVPCKKETFLELRFKKAEKINRLVLDPGEKTEAYPRDFTLHFSLQGKPVYTQTYKAPGLTGMDWMGNHPKIDLKGDLGISLKTPVLCDNLRIAINSAGGSPEAEWTIAELTVFEENKNCPILPHPDQVAPDELKKLHDLLQKEKIEAIYSNDLWNTYFTLYYENRIKTVTLTERMNEKLYKMTRNIFFNRKNAFLIPHIHPGIMVNLQKEQIPVNVIPFSFGDLILTSPVLYKAPYFWDNCQFYNLSLKQEAFELLSKAEEFSLKKQWKLLKNTCKEVTRIYPFFLDAFKLLKKSYDQLGKPDKAKVIQAYISDELTPKIISDTEFESHLRFMGMTVHSDKNTLKPGGTLDLTYYWHCLKKEERDLSAFIHFENAEGQTLFQDDYEKTAGNNPMKEWLPGEIIKIKSSVRIPDSLSPQPVRMYLGVWEPQKGRRLKISRKKSSEKDRSIFVMDFTIL